MTTQPDRRQPLIIDDDWEPPPSTRSVGVRALLKTSGIVLAIALIAVVLIRAAWKQDSGRPAQDWEVHRPIANVSADAAASPWSPIESARVPAEWQPPAPRSRRSTSNLPGYVAVSSTPWAELSVDGHAFGNTPQLSVRVTPGRHRVVLARTGFATYSTWVTVRAGATVRITNVALQRIAP
jgi:PEGA domain-containing protein